MMKRMIINIKKKENGEETGQDDRMEENEYEQTDSYEDVEERPYHRKQRDYDSYYYEGGRVGGFASALMKIFFCLMMIPFVGVIIGLCCALGAMIVLSMEGFTMMGAYFLLIGAIIVTSAFLSALYRLLWKRGRR